MVLRPAAIARPTSWSVAECPFSLAFFDGPDLAMKGRQVGMRKENHPIAQFKDNLQVIHAKGHWYSRKHEGRQGTRGLACGGVAGGSAIITALDEDLPKLPNRVCICLPASCGQFITVLGLSTTTYDPVQLPEPHSGSFDSPTPVQDVQE
jgi:hypothetical protein